MLQIGLNQAFWRGSKIEEPEDMARMTKEAGLDVMELRIQYVLDMDDARRRDFKKLLHDLGLKLIYTGGLSAQTNITSYDAARQNAGVEYSKRAIEIGAMTGGDRWCGVNYVEQNAKPDAPLSFEEKRRRFDNSVKCMRRIIRTAEDHHLCYCYEITNRFENFLLNTVAEGVAYCEAVDSPNALVLLDSFHRNIEEDDSREALLFAHGKGRLGHVHVGESNRRIPGPGKTTINWDRFFGTLKEIGYNRIINLEPMVLITPMAGTFIWRDLAPRDFDLYLRALKDGVRFVRSMMA
ncbi:MAG: sugar phosphate isomerase/epimerase family protein [Christensenellales bacterium]